MSRKRTWPSTEEEMDSKIREGGGTESQNGSTTSFNSSTSQVTIEPLPVSIHRYYFHISYTCVNLEHFPSNRVLQK